MVLPLICSSFFLVPHNISKARFFAASSGCLSFRCYGVPNNQMKEIPSTSPTFQQPFAQAVKEKKKQSVKEKKKQSVSNQTIRELSTCLSDSKSEINCIFLLLWILAVLDYQPAQSQASQVLKE
jgi:hypothetical protein